MSKNVRRGANRQEKPRFSPGALLRGLSLVLVIGLAGAALWGMRELYRLVDQPLTDVRVGGQLTYLQPQELSRLVQENLSGGFLSVDLIGLQTKLVGHPWIAEVSLRRQWPSMLEVQVLEEQPIARWGEHGFLNQRGEELVVGDNGLLRGLPVLRSGYGGGDSAPEMMRQYQQLAQLLAAVDLRVAELQRDALGTWRVELQAQFSLVLGRDQMAEKIRRFTKVWQSGLQAHQARIEKVDLRYPNGLAVSWKGVADETVARVGAAGNVTGLTIQG